MIQLSLGLVLIGSPIGCFADSFAGLLIARIVMGAVMPMLALPEAVASDTMPRERASVVIAAIHAGTGTGIGGGLILGGLAGAGDASWRWFFIVGAIASGIGILASWAWLRDMPERATGTLDLVGAVLLAVGLGAVLLAVSEGPTWGWDTLLALCLDSFGLATILALTQIVMVRSVPASQSGIVLGLAIIIYTLGNAIGTSVVAVFFQSFGSTPEAPSLHAFRIAYLFGGAAAIGALALCVPLGLRMRRGGAGEPVSDGAAAEPGVAGVGVVK